MDGVISRSFPKFYSEDVFAVASYPCPHRVSDRCPASQTLGWSSSHATPDTGSHFNPCMKPSALNTHWHIESTFIRRADLALQRLPLSLRAERGREAPCPVCGTLRHNESVPTLPLWVTDHSKELLNDRGTLQSGWMVSRNVCP